MRFKDSYDKKLRYPPEILLNKRNYDHIILWMLSNNEYCKYSDFLDRPLSINHNSLSKNLNLLLKKGLVEREKTKYRITDQGELQYSKILKKYDLDYQTILEEEVKRIENVKEKVNDLLEKFEIKDDEIKVILLDLVNHLDYATIENLFSLEEDYYKILLFFSLNHPNNYPEYILPEAFSLKFDIKIATLNFFIQKIVEENACQIKFFKLGINDNGAYYFRIDEKFEKMLYLIIDENIVKFSYLTKLKPNVPNEKQIFQTMILLENIVDDLSNKLFDEKIKPHIIKFLPEYIKYLYSKFQRADYSNNGMEKFKGIAYQNIINIDLNDFNEIVNKKKIITNLMNTFPKYTMLDEIKKKWKK
jgi:predicted transcriptional regulator